MPSTSSTRVSVGQSHSPCTALAMPKSTSLTNSRARPDLTSMMLLGLMSRCTSPAWWITSRVVSTWITISTASSTGSGAWRLR